MTEKLAIGVDVGGTNTVTGLVDTEGKTHGERSFKTREYPYFEDYVERLVQDIESLRRIAPRYGARGHRHRGSERQLFQRRGREPNQHPVV